MHDLADAAEKFGGMFDYEKFIQGTCILDLILDEVLLLTERVDGDGSNRVFDMACLPRQIKIQDQKDEI